MKKETRLSAKLAIITGIIDVILVFGGMPADIIYWNYWYQHRPEGVTGHGVPVFSLLGIMLAIIISIIMTIVIVIVCSKERNRIINQRKNKVPTDR